VHGLSNASLDTPWPKTLRLRAALAGWLTGPGNAAPDTAPLFAALADEQAPPDADLPNTGVGLAAERVLGTPFIRGTGYGTRASTVACIGAAGAFVEERRFGPGGVPLGDTRVGL
jgi:uncharacterized protein with NRDE domain